VRRRFDYLNGELAVLSSDVEELTREILNSPGYRGDPDKIQHEDKAEAETVVEGDEINTLGNRLHAMHTEMEAYLDYMHAQVNTDALTRVGNTTAYLERQKNIDAGILNNTAAFSAVMFDINDLKRINDRYGHAGGDKAIQAAASVIAEVYGNQNTFRVGGDEFIVIVEQVTEEELDESDERIKALVEEFNETKPDGEAMVSLSWGRATFVPGEDHSFRDVFVRADSLMYERKESYHRSEGV
jgi:diguanylate cyclase (GGDEF)-like protein